MRVPGLVGQRPGAAPRLSRAPGRSNGKSGSSGRRLVSSPDTIAARFPFGDFRDCPLAGSRSFLRVEVVSRARRAGRELASQIPNARYVELPGIDHLPWAGDPDPVLGEVEEFLTGTRSLPETDRVLATVMFTDLVGSTERAATVGDARWRDLLAEHQVSVRRELAHFRGHEVKTLGDGFLATFDGPARAIRCADAIATDGRSLGLEVRVGLHTGEVELVGQDVGGIAVHIAARVRRAIAFSCTIGFQRAIAMATPPSCRLPPRTRLRTRGHLVDGAVVARCCVPSAPKARLAPARAPRSRKR